MGRPVNSAHAHAHDMRLLIGGVELFAAMIKAIDDAQLEVRLETYIFSFEGAGANVALALMRAAQRGVNVFMLVDGVGTGELPVRWAERMAQAGVQVHVFAPAVGPGFWLQAVGDVCTASCVWLTKVWHFAAASTSWMTFWTRMCKDY